METSRFTPRLFVASAMFDVLGAICIALAFGPFTYHVRRGGTDAKLHEHWHGYDLMHAAVVAAVVCFALGLASMMRALRTARAGAR